MGDSSIDEMVTGVPSLERRAEGLAKAYVIGSLIYAFLLLAGIGFLLWLGSIS